MRIAQFGHLRLEHSRLVSQVGDTSELPGRERVGGRGGGFRLFLTDCTFEILSTFRGGKTTARESSMPSSWPSSEENSVEKY